MSLSQRPLDLLKRADNNQPGHVNPKTTAVTKATRDSPVAELLAAYSTGTPIDDLAARVGVHRTTVIAHVKRAGLESRQGIVERRLSEAIDLYAAVLLTAQIGKQMGVHGDTVWLALRRHGVQLREGDGRSPAGPIPPR